MLRRLLPLLAVSVLAACSDDDGNADDDATSDVNVDAPTDAGEDANTTDAGADTVADAGTADTSDTTDVATDVAEDTAVPDAGPRPSLEEQIGDWTPPGDLSLPDALVPSGDEFMVVVIPDTQIYAQRFPETFDRHMRWIADHADAYRIVFVSHVGDVVQTASATNEWTVARAAYDWIDEADIPHGFSIGGHDTSVRDGRDFDSSCSPFPHIDCNSVDFIEHFGPARYADRDWFGGASPSGLSTYQRVAVDERELLFLHLPQDTPAAEVEWAGEVLDANPGAIAHLTTHRYLFDYRLTEELPSPLSLLTAGRFTPLTYTLGGQSLMYLDGLEADVLFRRLVKQHPNIWGVHCGHVDAEFRQQSVNDAGLPVHEVLVDFQDMADGGGGWLRLLRFRPSDRELDVITFSTETGELRRDGDGFEHSLEIVEYYRNAYGDDLRSFGLDDEELDQLLVDVATPGEFQDRYIESLYGEGQRDSLFTVELDLDAYADAGR